MQEPERSSPGQNERPTPPWDNDEPAGDGSNRPNTKRLLLWGGVALLVIALLATAWYLGHNKAGTSDNTATLQSNNADDTNTIPALTNGTDNASLGQDLKTVNTGISKDSTNLTNSDKGVNDQQNQIEVPTE